MKYSPEKRLKAFDIRDGVTPKQQGRVQIRVEQGSRPAYSLPVFWRVFRIRNTSEHLIGVPQHFNTLTGPARIVDNWGNSYRSDELSLSMAGGNYTGVTLPFPAKNGTGYKPGESSLQLQTIALDDFVSGIHELRIYLGCEQYIPTTRKTSYKLWTIREPMQRRRDPLWGQTEPQVSAGVQENRPQRLSVQAPLSLDIEIASSYIRK
jgi:hypothetical protein